MKHMAEVKPDRLPQAPLWVLSFADMITNLMAAFVMLQAFASATPTAATFKAGQGSFKRAIKNFGLPSWLVDRYHPPAVGKEGKPTHSMEEQDQPNRQRVIDAEGDDLRRVFDQLTKNMDVASSDPSETMLSRTLTPVSFAPGEADLTPEGRDYLQKLGGTMKQDITAKGVKVLVIALAADEPNVGARRLLSARRAAGAAGNALAPGVRRAGRDDLRPGGRAG
ncbi:MAG: hypothetical protein NT031_12980 [Planctomycetota bacterium]|nr:hypothetical protein [Planctomycetota bacterium]